MPVVNEAGNNQQANHTENDADERAEPTGGTLRTRRDGDSPLAAKIKQSIAEMERSREDSDHVKRGVVRIREVMRDAGKSRSPVRGEALDPHVPNDVREERDAGPALQDVHPVRHPRMAQNVGFAAPPNIQAVASVKCDGQPDEKKFDGNAPRNLFEARGGGVIPFGADKDVAVGPEMLGEECANRNYAAERMQFVPKITGVRFRGRARHPLSEKVPAIT